MQGNPPPRLLSRSEAALPAGGTLIVYVMLIDDERREKAFALRMSLNMLVESPGGFDFTETDCKSWTPRPASVSPVSSTSSAPSRWSSPRNELLAALPGVLGPLVPLGLLVVLAELGRAALVGAVELVGTVAIVVSRSLHGTCLPGGAEL